MKVKNITDKQYNKLIGMIRKRENKKDIIFDDNLLNLSLRKSNRNSLKNRLRVYLQTVFSTEQRETKIALSSGIGVRRKKFKNKELIEVSNPQTDYKFFRKI